VGTRIGGRTYGASAGHFHPGAFVFSSKRDKSREVEGEERSSIVGRSRRVMEKPGMFRLVYSIANFIFQWTRKLKKFTMNVPANTL
jgi:hypothetical protein